MKLIRNSLAAGIAFTALAVACSSQHSSTGSGSGSSGPTPIGISVGSQGGFGSVGLHLDIGTPPNGATVTQLNWTISNGTNTYTGTNVVGDAQSFEFVQGGIAAGTGYTVTLTGADSKGDPCTGVSSTFTIVAGAVTQTTLVVTCTVPTDASTAANVVTGGVEVDAGFNLMFTGPTACPGIASFSVSPAEINLSQTAALTLTTVGPPSTLTWSVTPSTGGSFGNVNSPNTTFACAPGAAFVPQVTVTATIALPDSGACTGQTFTTQSVLVNCESGLLVCAAPTVNCNDAGTCINLTNNVNNCGTCGNVCPAGGTGQTAACVSSACTLITTPASLPCTQIAGTTPQDNTGSANCVKCDQNTNGVCSGTEAIIVQRDIEKGLVSGTTPTAGSCYECAATGDIIDSQTNGFTGLECEDLAASTVQQCYDALNCILGSPQSGTAGKTGNKNSAATAASLAADCSNAPTTASSGPVDGVFNCFCGSAETDVTDCKAGGTVAAMTSGGLGVASPNGVCIPQVLAGTGTTSSTSNTTIIGDLSGTANAAAVAFSIPQGAGSNLSTGASCSQCYQ